MKKVTQYILSCGLGNTKLRRWHLEAGGDNILLSSFQPLAWLRGTLQLLAKLTRVKLSSFKSVKKNGCCGYSNVLSLMLTVALDFVVLHCKCMRESYETLKRISKQLHLLESSFQKLINQFFPLMQDCTWPTGNWKVLRSFNFRFISRKYIFLGGKFQRSRKCYLSLQLSQAVNFD